MDAIANTKKVSMSLVSEVIVTVLVKKRITLADLSVVSDIALELGIPSYATFTYDPANQIPSDLDTLSRITFKWAKRSDAKFSDPKKSYKSIYGREY